jgi:hypothetical protein
MNLMEHMRDNAGVEDIEYLSEGIVFFKNSSKIKRLAKIIERKREKMMTKGDLATAKELKPVVEESLKVAIAFEHIERMFKEAKTKEAKTEARAKYKVAEQKFKNLLKIIKKEDTKKALAVTGSLVAVAAIIMAGGIGIQSLNSSGVLSSALTNIGSRINKVKVGATPDVALLGGSTGSDAVDSKLASGARLGLNFVNDQKIKRTNDALLKTVGTAGATVGGLASVGFIKKLTESGRKNKVLADTARALEDLKKL